MADNVGLLAGLAQGVKGALEGYERSTLANEKKKELEAKRKADDFDRMIKTQEFKVKASDSGYDVQEDEQGNIKGLLPRKGFLSPKMSERRQETLKAGFIPDESGNISLDASGQPILAKFKQDEISQRGLLNQARIDSANASVQRQKQSVLKGKPPTEGQFKAATFAKRLEDAEKIFSDLESKGYDPTSMKEQATGALSGILGESVKSENLKSIQQAQRNFINAVLRKESGAAISESEFANAEQQYFPKAGDTPAIREQKRQNRLVALAGLKAEGGPASSLIEKSLGETVKPSASQIKNVNGVQYKKVPGGWEAI